LDITDLVLPKFKRLISSPAVHFALLGGLVVWLFGIDPGAENSPGDLRSTISLSQVQRVYAQITMEKGRPLTDGEKSDAIEVMLNREALFLYSREIGLDRDPVVQRRLSQIATFVSENPEETITAKTRVREAVELGLIESDSITRRILIDGARRLIRATALVQVPTTEGLQRYLEENPSRYQIPGRTRITHVALNRNLRKEKTIDAAKVMLSRLTAGGLSPEEGAALGDETVVDPSLPDMTDRAIARRFGVSFTEVLVDLPVGEWQGPIRSPLGEHIVFVHERRPPRRAMLGEVKEQVSSDIRNELADQVLIARVKELREQYGLKVDEVSL
jgi:hypothetical protein